MNRFAQRYITNNNKLKSMKFEVGIEYWPMLSDRNYFNAFLVHLYQGKIPLSTGDSCTLKIMLYDLTWFHYNLTTPY